MSETETNYIQSIEQDLLVQIFDTGRNCSQHLLWLESGQIPTEYMIQQYKLAYLQYILQQDERSLILRFFHSSYSERLQCKASVKPSLLTLHSKCGMFQ